MALVVLAGLAMVTWVVWDPTGSWSRWGKRGPITLAFAGDVLLDRGVRVAIESTGLEALLTGAMDLFRGTQFGLVNMECPATRVKEPAAKRFVFRAEPEWLRGLRDSGVTHVCLANNHSLDQGSAGLEETIRAAEGYGLGVVGAGLTPVEARRPRVALVGPGIRIALLAYSVFPQEGVVFNPSRPWICSFDPATFKAEVEEARRLADLVVVSFHWGREFADRPSTAQVDLAHRAAEWGADIVVGHHPHTVQGIELYRPSDPSSRTCVIAYSLGNFVFDQKGDLTEETFILKVTVGRLHGIAVGRDRFGVTSVTVVPVLIEDCSPRPARGEDAERILSRIDELSRAFGTTVDGSGRVDLFYEGFTGKTENMY